MEELELVFNGLDTAGTGRLSTEEFTAGLRKCQQAASNKCSSCWVAHDGPRSVPMPGSQPMACLVTASIVLKSLVKALGWGVSGFGLCCRPRRALRVWGVLLAGQFLRSQKAARDHRRRKTASRRVRLVLPSPTLEGADSEERRHFAAFMDQLGTANVSEE